MQNSSNPSFRSSLLIGFAIFSHVLNAAYYSVLNRTELAAAINTVNAGSGSDTITLASDITLAGVLTSI